jgi:hypothetical protein
MMTASPEVTVIVVSDYGGGANTSWSELRATLDALAAQDFDEPFAVILSESRRVATRVPQDLGGSLARFQTLFTDSSESYALKNAGVQAAATPLVALIDADCRPDVAWLRTAVSAIRACPGTAAVSGRTVYAARGLRQRSLALLSRGYLDPGHAGSTRFISNNNAIYRRDAFLAHLLPIRLGPFAARIQSEALLRDAHELRFEPAMLVTHAYDGWAMERDIRRNVGYGTVITRLNDRRLPFAWLTRPGVVAIPLIVLGKTFDAFADGWRCHDAYGISAVQLPYVWLVAIRVQLMEARGMAEAFRGATIAGTAYR